MKEKYFTPSIDEFRVGYECERAIPDFGCFGSGCEPLGWEPFVFKAPISLREHNTFGTDMLMTYRVPYLTFYQIEKEGWKPTLDFKNSDMSFKAFEKGNLQSNGTPYRVVIEFSESILHLKMYAETISRHQYLSYYGPCKDINTFRFIVNLFNIKS